MKKFLALALLFFLLLLIAAFYQAMTLSLQDFPQKEIELGQQQLKVAVADNDQLRKQGLREVEELENLDGMLFVYSEPDVREFTMKDVLMPLTIAFYSAQGEFTGKKQMEPCAQDCPSYRSPGKFQYALEIPQQSRVILNTELKYD